MFAILLKVQSGTPADALFGVWVHSSGFAVSLVVLGFAANWGFPIIAGVLAGDLFAGEDRQGTWKTILTRSRSLGEVFAGKALAATALALALGVLLAISSLAAGLVLVGAHDMVDFAGRQLGPGHLLWLVGSQLADLPAAVARLHEPRASSSRSPAATGSSAYSVPMLVALLTQLLDLVGKGIWVHLLLIGSAFDAWHGLFVGHAFFGPLARLAGRVPGLDRRVARRLVADPRRREFVAGSAPARGAGGAGADRRWARSRLIAVLALASDLGPGRASPLGG